MKEKGGGSSHQKPLSSVTQAKMGIFCRYRARGRESSTKRKFLFLVCLQDIGAFLIQSNAYICQSCFRHLLQGKGEQ